LAIGAEKAHCPTYQAEEASAAHQTGEDLDPTSVEENEESAESSNQRVMERCAISETGSAKALFHLFPNKSEVHEKEVVHAQMMAPRQKDSEIADHLQPHGVRDAHKDRKMAAQDHHDVSSRNGLLLSVLPPPLSRIVNGAQRCDPMHLLPNLLSHLAMVAHLLHLHPQLLFLSADPD
jgi:hypothetical protein